MSLAAWADSKTGAKTDALAKVEELPPYKRGRVRVPLPYVDRKAYKADFTNREINRAIEDGTVKKVAVKKLHAIQHSVVPERVAAYVLHPDIIPEGARSPEHGGLVDKPVIVKYKDKLYVHDGHHRATAAILSGDKTIEARVADLDAAK